MDSNPSLTQFFAWKIARLADSKAKVRSRTHVHNWLQATIRLMLHIAGFSCLTIAGFHWHVIAGYVVAGLSLFVLSWLLMPSTEPSDHAQPMR